MNEFLNFYSNATYLRPKPPRFCSVSAIFSYKVLIVTITMWNLQWRCLFVFLQFRLKLAIIHRKIWRKNKGNVTHSYYLLVWNFWEFYANCLSHDLQSGAWINLEFGINVILLNLWSCNIIVNIPSKDNTLCLLCSILICILLIPKTIFIWVDLPHMYPIICHLLALRCWYEFSIIYF